MTELNVDRLTFRYRREEPMFENLSVTLKGRSNRGKVIAVVGRSGCGKSTLLKLLAGVLRPVSGAVTVSPREAQLSYLPQDAVLFDHLSVSQNARYFERVSAVRSRVDERHVVELARQLEASELLASKSRIADLSGGERQRIALLRALSIRPDVLFLDEPCTGLDRGVKQEFLASLRSAIEGRGTLVVYVTHHAEEAELVADEVVFIEDGVNAGPVRIWQGALGAIKEEPPQLALAEFFEGPFFSKMRCAVRGGWLCAGDEEWVLGALAPTDTKFEDVGIAGFTPRQVVWGVGEVPVEWTSNSDRFTFCRHRGGARELIVGLRAKGPPSTVSLEGRVWWFDRDGAYRGRYRVSPLD